MPPPDPAVASPPTIPSASACVRNLEFLEIVDSALHLEFADSVPRVQFADSVPRVLITGFGPRLQWLGVLACVVGGGVSPVPVPVERT